MRTKWKNMWENRINARESGPHEFKMAAWNRWISSTSSGVRIYCSISASDISLLKGCWHLSGSNDGFFGAKMQGGSSKLGAGFPHSVLKTSMLVVFKRTGESLWTCSICESCEASCRSSSIWLLRTSSINFTTDRSDRRLWMSHGKVCARARSNLRISCTRARTLVE